MRTKSVGRATALAAIVIVIAVLVAIVRTYAGGPDDATFTAGGRSGSAIPAGLDGRQFVAVETSAGDETHRFGKNTVAVTFSIDGYAEIAGCGSDNFRYGDGADGWVGPLIFALADCDPIEAGYHWRSAYSEGRPSWRLRDNTLTITTATATARFVDDGAGRKVDELMGHRFVANNWSAPDFVPPDTYLNARIVPNLQLELSFDPDGALRATLGCDSVVVPTHITAGRLRLAGELDPTSTTDCSPTMAEQETSWLWDILDESLTWQAFFGNLTLRSADGLLYLEPADGVAHSTEPNRVTGKTFVAVAVHNSQGANRAGLRRGEGITVTIENDGRLTANAGCPRVSIRATVRSGWIRYDGQDGGSRADCPNPAGEGWLGNFFARQPSWRLKHSGSIVMSAGRATLHLAPKAACKRSYSC